MPTVIGGSVGRITTARKSVFDNPGSLSPTVRISGFAEPLLLPNPRFIPRSEEPEVGPV